jgi:hypothetical protein
MKKFLGQLKIIKVSILTFTATHICRVKKKLLIFF